MLFALIFTSILPVINSRKTFGDVFPHKHKHPVPFPIPGWSPDTNPWDEALYPPFRPELTRRRSKPPQVRLTSDSPAMNGSCLSFTAALEFPPCQKGDASDDCEDARGEVHSGYVFNWTGPDEKGGVFPDGTPLPLSSDWRRRGYVYVWHVMGQYLQTCDGSSSHVTLNTTNMTFGAGVMEVMVYRKRQRRKYSPLSTDTTVFFITDKIPFSVNISQKAVVNSSEQKVFISGSDVVFSVQLHDPSGYLKTADALDYIWDFQDGNHLVTHSSVATHAYSRPANLTVKLLLEASFRVTCPAPATPTTVHATQTHTTAPPTSGATTAALETSKASTSAAPPTTSAAPPTTQSVPPQTSPAAVKRVRVQPNDCFRHVYGLFEGQIAVVSPPPVSHAAPANQIVAVSAAQVSNTSVNFMVTCTGSVPSVACTIVASSACQEVQNIICEDVATSDEGCKVSLTRIFQTPGTYCVNITLGVPGGLALATTTSVTVGKRAEHNTPPSSRVSQVVLSSSAVLFAIFALIAIVVYKRYRVYRPVRRCVRSETEKSSWSFHRFRAVLFSSREERSRLLSV